MGSLIFGATGNAVFSLELIIVQVLTNETDYFGCAALCFETWGNWNVYRAMLGV